MFYKCKFDNLKLNAFKKKIVSFSYSELEDEPSFLHSHRYFEIIIPMNNYGKVVAVDQSIVMKNDCIYIVPSNITHTEKNILSNEKFSYFTIKVNECLKMEKQKIAEVEIDHQIFSSIKSRLMNAYRDYIKNDEKTDMLLYLDVYIGYEKLLNELFKQNFAFESDNKKQYSSFVLEIQNYLVTNYQTPITIDQLADKFGLSRSSLEKKFKHDTGITAKTFLNNYRLETASYLLSSSDYSINQIASLCGFTNAAYFTYFFRLKNKMTPCEYRSKNKI